MPDTAPRCPDCSVTMEEMEIHTANIRFRSDESREGIMGTLGMYQTYQSETFVCPECGLSRLYADIDGA